MGGTSDTERDVDTETRPILYGVADYAEIRKANAWFVDRTAKIRDLEATRYALFLRPRRFGKSLLTSILQAYYDVRYASRFDEFFSGTDIGANPTEERGKYLVLKFDFSSVSKDISKVQGDFDYKSSLRCDDFARDYAEILPKGLGERIFKAPDIGKKLAEIMSGLRGSGLDLYIIIDEYDNFTNTILAESGQNAYGALCHGDGFFKQFFTDLKTLTTDLDAPLKRLFITGVSPVTMDDVTSGFNIGTNISLRPQFADLVGFSHDDIRAMCRYYAPRCGFDAEKAERTCLEWFDNYRFGDADFPPVANTTLVLYLFECLANAGTWPKDYIDANLRTDYSKIRHLLTLDRRLNGNFHVLENLISGGELSEPLIDSFQARELTRKENFTSLLYWLGITTIIDGRFGKTIFGIPNETLKKLSADMIPAAYADVHKIDERVFDINDGLCTFADNGDWCGFADVLGQIVKENFAVRDAIEGERVVQSTVVALLRASGGPYFVHHEGEAGGGFYDIALEPQLSRWPDIAHAGLIELKYLKVGDPPPTPEALAAIKAEAINQLDQYSADHHLIAEWRIGNGVSLHRLVLVFHGGDCILHEEV